MNPNNIQTIIDKFDKEFSGEEKHLTDYYVEEVKQFISNIIDQTREETIRECEDELPFYLGGSLGDNETAENRKGRNDVLKEIRQSLINLRSK